jgi:hypothetical protein
VLHDVEARLAERSRRALASACDVFCSGDGRRDLGSKFGWLADTGSSGCGGSADCVSDSGGRVVGWYCCACGCTLTGLVRRRYRPGIAECGSALRSAQFRSREVGWSTGRVNKDKVRGCNGLTPQSRGEGDRGAIPFTTARGRHFIGFGVGQSTVIRVAAVVPLICCTGVPTPT